VALSLRAREALALIAVVLVVVAVSTLAHLASVAQITMRSAADQGQLLARQLFHQSARAVARTADPSVAALRTEPGLRALMEGMVGYSRVVVYAVIVDPAGRAVVHSDPALEGSTPVDRDGLESLLGLGDLRLAVALLATPRIYEARLPLQLGDRPFGAVRVGISTSLVREELRTALLHSVTLGVLAILVALAAGLGAGRVVLELARRVVRGVGRLARGELGGRVELDRGEDMGTLAARVTGLGARITPAGVHAPTVAGAIDTLEDAVVLLDAARQVVFVNQAAARLLGPAGGLAGRTLPAGLPAGHPLLEVEASLFERGRRARHRRLELPAPDGERRELAVSSYRLPARHDSAATGGGVLVIQDLEPVRAVESLVSYSQKLAALGRLTSGLAHEVKTPLNAMRIHLELLRIRLTSSGSAGALPAGATESLEVIAREIQRLDQVVQGFLRFMRPQDLALEPVDVNALLHEVARVVAPEASRGGVEIVLELATHLPAVTGDAALLGQAITNLVANAIQAMPDGGTLTLATRALRRGAVELRVRDQGVGIPPEAVEDIFRLYYTTKPHGSGIGLSLVYRIVQLHDGRIDVESSVGKGTTMIVTLPSVPVTAGA
jgi:signal transduction histidine kinase